MLNISKMDYSYVGNIKVCIASCLMLEPESPYLSLWEQLSKSWNPEIVSKERKGQPLAKK